MKKLAALAMAVIMMFSVAFAAETEPEQFNVFLGVEWGDSLESVKIILGNPDRKSSIDVIDYITYRDVEFAGEEATCVMYFTEDQLTSIMFMFILPPETFFNSMAYAFESEFGIPDETGELLYAWVLPDETRIEVTTDKHGNSVNLDIENRTAFDENSKIDPANVDGL